MASVIGPLKSRPLSNQTVYWILGALMVVAATVFFVRQTGTIAAPANPGSSSPMAPSDSGLGPLQNDVLKDEGNSTPRR